MRLVRDAWLIFGIAVLALATVEGALRLRVTWSRRDRGGEAARDFRLRADAYPDRSWVPAYYEEFRRSRRLRWEPYAYWRRRPFRGEYINVGADGIRRTVAPGPPPEGRVPGARVFMLGGSTMWGTGARDAFTIPSLVARELAGRGVSAEVTNLGETGYVSGQELALLQQRLRSGDVPDVVVFYDGVNDTFSAWQQGKAGLPMNEFNRTREFNISNREMLGRRAVAVLREAAARLETVRVGARLLRAAGLQAGPARPRGRAAAGRRRRSVGDGEALARGVAAAYRSNVGIVRALGARYGFESLFFWQPTVFDKEGLTRYEQRQARRKGALREFFRLAAARVREEVCPGPGDLGCRDLSGIFAGTAAPVFVDWSHTGEGGNEVLAAAVAEDVAAMLAPRGARGGEEQ